MSKLRRKLDETANDIVSGVRGGRKPVQSGGAGLLLSTGSTLLDLAITGKRSRGGGIPGGILCEVFGPSGAGKTAILAEIAASCQSKGGDVRFLDPEARLDQEYSRIYGAEISQGNYLRPDTVTQMFDMIQNWIPIQSDKINVVAADSLAALSTEMEMGDEDKYGMRPAKEFSMCLRKICRKIANDNWLIVCSNQLREGPKGETTPGGNAIRFYSSLRIRVGPPAQGAKIPKVVTLANGKKVEKIIGIRSQCKIKKSSVDEPFRECFISIIFGYGIDDIRENLQYLKENTGSTTYKVADQEFRSMGKAIEYVETNNLQDTLKNEVIDLWSEIEDKFKIERPKKER
jgi:recombination protein RecA